MTEKIENKFVKKVVIASAFYEVKGYSPYIVSLVETIRALELIKVKWDYMEVSGDSYVDRAKNDLANRFMDDQEASHLFVIDSDHGWDVESFLRVLRAAMVGVELVGASYPCKNNWDYYGCVPRMSEPDEEGMQYHMGKEIGDIRLLDMHCIPGGFICYSKAAFKRVEPLLRTYACYSPKDKAQKIFTEYFLQQSLESDGQKTGEDVYFQRRFLEAGGTIYMEPNATITHIGVNFWRGNYHEKLMRERQAAQSANDINAAFDTLNKGIADLHNFETKLEDPEFKANLKQQIQEKRQCASN